MNDDLRFPVGRFDVAAPATPDMRPAAMAAIAELPARMRAAVSDLTDPQLDTPYRPGGWTVRQLVHHVADSHANGYIRLKLALTEDEPTIKPYRQDAWASLPDSRLRVSISLGMLDAVHARWSSLWQALEPAQFARRFRHPELGLLTLDTHLQLYAWHSRHHVAHITALRKREGWLGIG
ncbi:MAG: metal-dependent hydrolase [Acidobacteria bacterium RIFCSPLOWO2_12_FULL_67_14]|nr:MAG: metal-dependent hydrolase [Acidobacteria bacterium RIFCSPLOWO2_02_FULL_67_21]OFW36064.1 MAG: metal-dependent hydrolase [Acidobacteria bacterium RIFCSPLOWO2_12_FULL_67_14]